MEGLWLTSYIVLWIFVILEGLVILALARQIGSVLLRLGPVGARMMNAGLKIGETAPPVDAFDIVQGHRLTLGHLRDKSTLMVFVSATCPSCAELIPGLKTLNRSEKGMEIILVGSEEDAQANHNFIQKHLLTNIPFIASDDLAKRYQIGTTPYAVLVDTEGKISTKGLVNNMIHLESLLNAHETGHASIQNLIQANESRNGEAQQEASLLEA